MAKGKEFSDYNNIVELFVSDSPESKHYTVSEERRCHGKGLSNEDEDPNPYDREW